MSASLLTVVLFFVYTWGLGFSLTRLVRESENFLERNIMRIGFGLSAFIVLGIILNALHIPLDYRIFLLASVAVPLYWLFFRKGYTQLRIPKISLKLTVSNVVIAVVLLIFLFSWFMYTSGAFSYPYLEDDDPWGHATAAKYVSVMKTTFDSPYLNFQYMDPYPPGYDMTFGILAQTASSVYWVLKFFNALLISLSLLFFFFFAKEFLGSRAKALFATFVLASVPAYLSHFIWAPALAMAVFFQTMYALGMIKNDKKWWIVAGVCFASILLAHPTHAVKLSALIAIYVGVKLIYSFISDKKAWLAQNLDYVNGVALGAALSLFWWAFKLKAFAGISRSGFRSGQAAAEQAIAHSSNIFTKVWTIITQALNAEGGTATRAYSLSDFVFAHSQNMINNPIGFGVVVSLLVFAGMVAAIMKFSVSVSRRESPPVWLPITLGWLIFTFLGVNSKTFNLPIGLFAFRFWMILAIPFAIIAAEGFFALLDGISLLKLDKASGTAIKVLLILIVVAGVLFTSTKQKYDVNTANWPPGAFWTVIQNPSTGAIVAHELSDYHWLTTLPAGTRVFTFSNADQVIGFDLFACGWCKADYDMKQRFGNITAVELHDFLKANNYPYFIIGGLQTKSYGFNQTVILINDTASRTDLFTIVHQSQVALVFRTV